VDDWQYGDILRRAITKNPVTYQYVMYVQSAASYSSRRDHFVGLQLTEAPPLSIGQWINPPPIGALRKGLKRGLFERDPDDQ
jgi:hypothetical protein